MMQKQKNNRTTKSTYGFRPVAWISAFFHPVSREELHATQEAARREHADVQRVIEQSRKINEEFDKDFHGREAQKTGVGLKS